MPVQYPMPQAPQIEPIDPLRLLALRQQQDQIQRQKEMDLRDLQDKDKEAFFKGIAMGIPAESIAPTLQYLNPNIYNLGLEAEKARKKQEKAAAVEQSLPAIAQTMEPIQTRQGGLVLPPRSEAAGQAWIDAVQSGHPELAQQINTLADSMQNKASSEVGARAAQEGAQNRTAAYSSGLARGNMAYSEQLALKRDAIIRAREAVAAGQKLTADSTRMVLASGDKQAQRELVDALAAQGSSPDQIRRIIIDAQPHAIALNKEQAMKRLQSAANAKDLTVRDALQTVRTDPTDQVALDTLVVGGFATEMPWRLPGEPAAANYVIGDAQTNAQRIKGGLQMAGLDDKLHSLTAQLALAEQDPKAREQLRGFGGSDFMRSVQRFTGTLNPVVSAIGTKLTMVQKDVAGIGNVGQITDFEQMMAKLALPLTTEIIGADGQVNPAATARINELLHLSDMNKRSLTNPAIRAELNARVVEEMSSMTPEQRRLVSAYREAVVTGDPKTIEGASKSGGRAGLNLGRGPGSDAVSAGADEWESKLQLRGPN